MGIKSRLRLAVRGLILRDDRLLMVNAWPGGKSDLLCAPGGGLSLTNHCRTILYERFTRKRVLQ